MRTTLNEIRAKSPCADGWIKLLAHLGKTTTDDEPLDIATILDSNGLDDALWCLRAVEGHDREIRLFGVWCARQVQHLMTDQRSLDALNIAERFANGQATERQMRAAMAAAGVAAGAAAVAAAGVAARAAAIAAAGVAAGAAGAAAVAAAGVATGAAGAAGVAARAAATAAQSDKLREICAACEVTT